MRFLPLILVLGSFGFTSEARLNNAGIAQDIARTCAEGAFTQLACSQVTNGPVFDILVYVKNSYHADMISGGFRIAYQPIQLGPEAPRGIITVTGAGLRCSGHLLQTGTASDPNSWITATDISCRRLSHSRVNL